MPLDRHDAETIVRALLNAPIAPKGYAHLINVGTDRILDALEHNYFVRDLANGVGCFKYLEGHYGSGKTQFILSLTQRAHEHGIVTSFINVGVDCPFNSPVAIFRAVMCAFLPPPEASTANMVDGTGIEVLAQSWVRRRIREMGVTPGAEVPSAVQQQILRGFNLWTGAPDQQMALALTGLVKRLLAIDAGANSTRADGELIQWVRGDSLRSSELKNAYGLHEPANDANAFRRLKTTVGFLRRYLGYRGFLIAFDEGTRTSSFRRGSVKQKQAIENMLTMINENAEGQFGGVMFLYAATPDFRSEVITKSYQALADRIGTVAWSAGSPMVPLIDLEAQYSPDMLVEIGNRLMEVFAQAYDIGWNGEMQRSNIDRLIEAQLLEANLLTVPPRLFVYQYCRLLDQQRAGQQQLDDDGARAFVTGNPLPEFTDEAN